MSQDNQMKQAFLEEAGELLPELENALLELEEDPSDSDLINRVFRALHTIKGSGAMFGFEDIAEFTHEVETVYDKVRNGELTVNKEILDLSLTAKDQIQSLLFAPDAYDQEVVDRVKDTLKGMLDKERDVAAEDEQTSARGKATKGGASATYRVRFKPAQDIFKTGGNPLLLLEELSELGQAHFIAHTEDVPALEDLDPEACYVWWDVILNTDQGKNAIKDVFIFVEDESELLIQLIDDETDLDEEDLAYKRLGEILLERGDLNPLQLQQVLLSKKPLGELLSEAGLVSEQQIQSALTEQSAVRQARQKRAESDKSSSIRVPAEKLDNLVNLVGELVIAQTQLSRIAEQTADQNLDSVAEEIERLSNDLRENTLGIRMLPIGSSFGKFRRVVRDLSADLGKEIELVTEGAETELDKTVIERLNDPLVHLLRNSIDHGIETPEERQAQGKPAHGTIVFSAEQSGGNVIITISDDGKGIDPQSVRDKALERDIISSNADLSEKEIVNLIFEPGFSTTEQVSDISGRGVGMDVVKKNIAALRGSVEVESEKNAGCVVKVTLPLTLAIIEGLQVRIGPEYFIIPLAEVSECVELTRQEAEKKQGGEFVHFRDELVPYIRLRNWFQINGQRPDIEQIVLVNSEGALVGIAVDEIIGQQQTVIKNIGRIYKDIEGISGATIKGDGTMALILDVDPMVRAVQRNLKVSGDVA
jgi:two-component system chemotaxis sensor kinase CheA